MSGEVTDQKIDLASEEGGMFFRIRTDRHQTISVFPTKVTGKYCGDFAIGCAVMGLERINDHTETLVTRMVTRGVELQVRSINGVMDYRLGVITSIIQGNC
jgi:hypothetical protein